MKKYHAEYLKHRTEGVNARVALHWAKAKKKELPWCEELPDPNTDTLITPVPGVGSLHFSVVNDYDFNPWQDNEITAEWRRWDGEARKVSVGKRLGNGWYALDHWDHSSFYTIKFSGHSSYEERRKYHQSQGMSRSNADLSARRSIQKECEYWSSVARGQHSWVGWTVELVNNNEEEIEHDSCWGYSDDDLSYMADNANDAASEMVRKHWPKHIKYVDPIGSDFAHAMKAWYAAMVSSDDDRTIADPVFLSSLKANHGNRRFRSGRVVSVRVAAV